MVPMGGQERSQPHAAPASTTIVLMALLLATVAAAPGVSAQATDEHPAVGVWLIDGPG